MNYFDTDEPESYEECPKCKNKNIIKWVEQLIEVEFSVKTGKCIKRNKEGYPNCWGYKCKCGWHSCTYVE